ncbi:uncharacterized protein LOC122263416 [Penaeus japonicus]|uniref:uncharacterized protein LOC122263416 n=1 Tax=Penaeus japonicus TaxID=27405 RepID=UPI001C713B6D|nr:uncharacterized protein LOC122263416 [Penaeus japonicus]
MAGYMNSLNYFYVICVSGLVFSLQIDEGCVVKREWQIPWLWPEARLSAWVPDETRAPVFELTVTYGDYVLEKYKTVLDTSEVSTTKLKEEVVTASPHAIDGGRWVDFTYRVDVENRLSYDSGNVTRTLVNFTTPDLGLPTSLTLVGNNLTLNCKSGVRVWNVEREAEVRIPLDGSAEYFLSVYSNHDVLPSFMLGKETFSLSRTQTGITARENTYRNLTAFIQHNFTVACLRGARSMIACDIKLGDNQTSDRILYMNELPKTLLVKGSTAQFYVLLFPPKSDSSRASESTTAGNSAATILGVLLAIVLVAFLGVILYQYKKWNTLKKEKASETVKFQSEEKEALLSQEEPVLNSSFNPAARNTLHQAVLEGDIKLVKQVMAEIEPDNYSYVEAHLQSRMDIVKLIDSSVKAPVSVDIVLDVLQELDRRLEDVFNAAKAGLYKSGVDIYLRFYGLPGSVTDEEGKSLLHYVASCKGSDDAPLWSGESVLKLIKEHNCLPNAVDYKGRTCLHMLAYSASYSLSKVQWRGRQQTVEEAWVSLARSLIEGGCDPSLPDLAGEYPHAVARQKAKLKLHDLFQEYQQQRQEREADHFKQILRAIRNKNVERVKELLSPGSPEEPEYVNKLRFEAKRIEGHDQESLSLREHMQKLASDIESIGNDASWGVQEEQEIRKYLCIAARLGLPLTCQALGLDDVFLQPLLDEDKPVKKAVESKQTHVLIVLYRDLKMSLFSTTDETTLPKEMKDNVIQCELKQLNRFLERAGISVRMNKHFQLTEEKNGHDIKVCLQGIAKLGLESIYHEMTKSGRAPDINDAVEDLMGYNMLHLAALYGQLNMVEYLLMNKADVVAKGKNGFTAAHLAALRGNRECMLYLHAHMNTQNQLLNTEIHAGLTAEQLAQGYKALVEDFSNILLPEKDRLSVLSDPYATTKTKRLLQKKGLHLGITDKQSFRNTVSSMMFEKQQPCDVVKEMENLLQVVCHEDPRFGGEMVVPNPQGTLPSIFPEDSLQVYWQVDIKASTEIKPKHSDTEPCHLELSLDGNFLHGCFRDEFHKAVEKCLSTYTFTSKYIWLTYPCITRAETGTSLYLVFFDDGKVRLIRVLLIPVLKTVYPEDNHNKDVSKLLDRYMKNGVPVHIANRGENRWSYVLVQMENEILSQITEDQRLVLVACVFLTNILYSCWWFPKQHSRRHGRAWGYYAVGLAALPQSLLFSIFFDELSRTTEEQWTPSMFLDRIISIFERATCRKDGRRNVEEIPLFLDSRHTRARASPIIVSVIEYLKELRGRDRRSCATPSVEEAPYSF